MVAAYGLCACGNCEEVPRGGVVCGCRMVWCRAKDSRPARVDTAAHSASAHRHKARTRKPHTERRGTCTRHGRQNTAQMRAGRERVHVRGRGDKGGSGRRHHTQQHGRDAPKPRRARAAPHARRARAQRPHQHSGQRCGATHLAHTQHTQSTSCVLVLVGAAVGCGVGGSKGAQASGWLELAWTVRHRQRAFSHAEAPSQIVT